MVGWGGGGMYVSDQKGEGYFAVVTPYFIHLYVNCRHFILSYVTGSRRCQLSEFWPNRTPYTGVFGN